ncbi:MAG: hypothetical protein NZL99_07870, partial [Burkholderiaceae bacterium]|nr:hypothetical protein [Burkholderiaceae bacterium]
MRCIVYAAACAAALSLSACGGRGESAPAPANVAATPRDGHVLIRWDDDPRVSYWLFVSGNAALTTENFNQFPDARVVRNVRSPYVLCGYANGRPLYATMNGRIDGGPGGPGSPTLDVTPRAAGASWTVGSAPAAAFNAVAYVPLTTCQPGAPPG